MASNSRRRGFTLLEVLVAVMIIALAFTGLLSLHSRDLALVTRDQDMTRATLLMRELVAQVELFPDYSQLGTASGNFDGSPGFSWQREVRSTALDELREVRFRVLWGDRGRNSAELLYYVHVQPTTQ
ncbi:MAG TPA: prepilin-type N-terminal cleavage/methylation domain-containing protein [Candidatus Kryptonia bacterium]|nr:prepilin-type N-terminal cleavage/methylation domain-containing protein [Candidatus Kryptonia bacterium]